MRRRAQWCCAGVVLLFALSPLEAQYNTCEPSKVNATDAAALIESQRTAIKVSAAKFASAFPDTRRSGVKAKVKALPLITPLVSYTQARLEPARVDAIRAALELCQFNTALELYFGAARDTQLPDWVVYIPKDGKARHSLIRGSDSTGVYRGQRYVWAIVFAERPDTWAGPFQRDSAPPTYSITNTTVTTLPYTAPPTTPPTTPPPATGTQTTTLSTTKAAAAPPGPHLEFRRRLLKYESDPFLAAALKFGTAKFLGQAVEAAAVKDSNDAAPQVWMSELSANPKESSLYVGTGRQGLATNAQVVLSLHPAPNREMPEDLRDVYANLVNSAQPRWEFGLAFGASIAERSQRVDTLIGGFKDTVPLRDTVRTSPRVKQNVLFMAYFNLLPPSLPLRHHSVSVAFGASAANLLDDFFVGGATTLTKGKLGVIAGCIWEKKVDVNGKTTPATRKETRVRRVLVGLDLRI